jgi:hypothetical protein
LGKLLQSTQVAGVAESKTQPELHAVQMGPSAHVWQLGKLLQSTQVAGVAEFKT